MGRKTVYNKNLVTPEKWEAVNKIELSMLEASKKYRIVGFEEPLIQQCGYNDIEGFSKRNRNIHVSKAYALWHGMLNRCYSEKCHDRQPTYKNVEVCEEWRLASNFFKWFLKNSKVFEINDIKFALDKDLLSNNECKIYSPETCLFLPVKINTFLARGTKDKNKSGIIGYFIRERDVTIGGVKKKRIERSITVCDFLSGKKIIKYLKSTDDVVKERLNLLNIYVIPSMKSYLKDINERIGEEYYTEEIIRKLEEEFLSIEIEVIKHE